MSLMVAALTKGGILLAEDRMATSVDSHKNSVYDRTCRKLFWADKNTVVGYIGHTLAKREGSSAVSVDWLTKHAIMDSRYGMDMVPYAILKRVQDFKCKPECVWFVVQGSKMVRRCHIVCPDNVNYDIPEQVGIALDDKCGYKCAGVTTVAKAMLDDADWENMSLEDACRLVRATFTATNIVLRHGGLGELVTSECDMYAIKSDGSARWRYGGPGYLMERSMDGADIHGTRPSNDDDDDISIVCGEVT